MRGVVGFKKGKNTFFLSNELTLSAVCTVYRSTGGIIIKMCVSGPEGQAKSCFGREIFPKISFVEPVWESKGYEGVTGDKFAALTPRNCPILPEGEVAGKNFWHFQSEVKP